MTMHSQPPILCPQLFQLMTIDVESYIIIKNTEGPMCYAHWQAKARPRLHSTYVSRLVQSSIHPVPLLVYTTTIGEQGQERSMSKHDNMHACCGQVCTSIESSDSSQCCRCIQINTADDSMLLICAFLRWFLDRECLYYTTYQKLRRRFSC